MADFRMSPKWQRWLEKNKANFDSQWEEKFVLEVLAQVTGIDFDFVRAQFPFKDADGKQRYCDFVIHEGDGVRIALEVDGYDKTGTGTGMTRDEFVDWQRRQAALVSQGWRLLRFANTDVRDWAARCREHISLLLRHERESSGHQRQLEEVVQRLQAELTEATAKSQRTIDELTRQLEQAQAERVTGSERAEELKARVVKLQSELTEATSKREDRLGDLKTQIDRVRTQLNHAQNTPPLTADESAHLAELNAAQEQIEILEKENSTMKTTIWAFTALLAVVILAFTFYASRSAPSIDRHVTQSVPADTSAESPPAATSMPTTPVAQTGVRTEATAGDDANAATVIGSSCDNPVQWQDAGAYADEWVAVAGPVMEVTQSTKSKGQPTWINIGARFPNPSRLTLMIWEDHRPQFEQILSQLDTSYVCAEGKVIMHKGQAQINLRSAQQIIIQ